jgi:phage regulator Rha-like protein
MSVMNPQATEEISVDSLVIAHVLGRAHRKAEAQNAQNEARTILHMAHSFADELETTDPRFDRQRFIQAATKKRGVAMSVMNVQAAEEISVDSLVIAHVLGRAHRKAEAQNAPDEARAILQMDHSFADELETTDPRFDRQRFIQAAKEHQS